MTEEQDDGFQLPPRNTPAGVRYLKRRAEESQLTTELIQGLMLTVRSLAERYMEEHGPECQCPGCVEGESHPEDCSAHFIFSGWAHVARIMAAEAGLFAFAPPAADADTHGGDLRAMAELSDLIDDLYPGEPDAADTPAVVAAT